VTLDDIHPLSAFFADPGVSEWIYDLPRPVTDENVLTWIDTRLASWRRGECVLSVVTNEAGEVISYSDVTVWPQHASAELAGAMRSDRQNSGQGSANVLATFDWIFETLGARLMCLTASLDNVRSQKMIDNAGFVRMGERDGVRPDGSTRRSIYWELTRERWRARKAGRTS
jgi:RimJ/RimL family protein N-acetyltransferase